jgi:hypothetical protein
VSFPELILPVLGVIIVAATLWNLRGYRKRDKTEMDQQDSWHGDYLGRPGGDLD